MSDKSETGESGNSENSLYRLYAHIGSPYSMKMRSLEDRNFNRDNHLASQVSEERNGPGTRLPIGT